MATEKSLEMKQALEQFIGRLAQQDEHQINRLMACEVVDCSFEEKWLTFAFDIKDWMLNPNGTLHGGLLCTALDIAMGSLTVYLSDMRRAPTINLNCNFLRPILSGDVLLVTATCVSHGRNLCSLTAIGTSQQNGKTVASASGTFFPGASNK